MWLVPGVLAITAIIAAIEVPALRKDKKGLWIFSILLLIGTGISIAKGLNTVLPNPLDLIAAVFQPFSHWQQLFVS
ncbi:hypothetical protein [Cohnella luojiensis]|uniref:Uncharacterized protein n=1 Tax=Cohnella luojiensis TaxID=652876 RepID=A0A4Y8LQU1_9BACL|nr:hypothetical protein [Cohnella luojiensis]TFE22784.1 hypothetical protein E2980_20545 [Cohnella luojiensis]